MAQRRDLHSDRRFRAMSLVERGAYLSLADEADRVGDFRALPKRTLRQAVAVSLGVPEGEAWAVVEALAGADALTIESDRLRLLINTTRGPRGGRGGAERMRDLRAARAGGNGAQAPSHVTPTDPSHVTPTDPSHVTPTDPSQAPSHVTQAANTAPGADEPEPPDSDSASGLTVTAKQHEIIRESAERDGSVTSLQNGIATPTKPSGGAEQIRHNAVTGVETQHILFSEEPDTSSGNRPRVGGTGEKRRRNTNVESASAAVREAFGYWQVTCDHPRAVLDLKRRAAIEAALKRGHSVADLKRAIDGCKASAFHQGENPNRAVYDDIELICRDAKHVEQFQRLASPAAETLPVHDPADPWSGPNLTRERLARERAAREASHG